MSTLEWSKEVLDLCVEFKGEGVVGIDIAGDERLANPTHELHVKAFEVDSFLCWLLMLYFLQRKKNCVNNEMRQRK